MPSGRQASPGPRPAPSRSVGYTNLDQLAGASEAELLSLQGMGTKAIRALRDALKSRGKRLR